ncbi:hypothetical protein TNCV_617321 [Trichonephila clavipes]|nr:hypothetical protein TNCV_617321 [Trichonephila clavipes]
MFNSTTRRSYTRYDQLVLLPDLSHPSERSVIHLIRYHSKKKSPEQLNTWKNDHKAGGGRTVTSVASDFGINKSVVSRAWKAFQTICAAVRRLVVAARGRQLQGMTDISSCRRKVADSSQQASLLSNSVQQKGQQVSRFTVARRLHKWGLFAHCLKCCFPLN